MKKIIRLTESQLYRLIRKTLNESLHYGGFIYGSDAVQINSEEDLDNLLHKWTLDSFQDWKDAIAPKIKMGDYILPVKCSDHGGELYDWAAIVYFNSNFPNNINTEEGQYGAEYGFIWGSESFLNNELELATDDFLADLRSNAVHEEIEFIEEWYKIQLDDETRDELFDFFYDCSCPRNTFDYRESDLEDILKENGYLQGEANESIVRKVTENIIRKLRRLN